MIRELIEWVALGIEVLAVVIILGGIIYGIVRLKRRKPMNVKSKVTLVLVGLVMVMACVLTAAAQEKPTDDMQDAPAKEGESQSQSLTEINKKLTNPIGKSNVSGPPLSKPHNPPEWWAAVLITD